MKQMFFLLFLIVFLFSCEDELNSPNEDIPSSVGCADPVAYNYELLANTNDGSCIYNEQENIAYESCEDGEWSHHTCINPVDGYALSSWNGSDVVCSDQGYTYIAGSCNMRSDDGSSNGE